MAFRRNIPGYITPENEESYHDNAWAQYITSLGRYTAKHRVEGEMAREQDKLRALGQERPGLFTTPLYDVAEAM